MKSLLTKPACLLLALASSLPAGADAATLRVTTQQEFSDVVEELSPGDVVQLANGVWEDFEILFTGEGTAEQPITLTAQEKGKAIISGRSNLRLAGKHLVVSGLVFKNGYTPTSEVISFRRNQDDLAYHSRVTEVVIDGFNNPERTETDYWVILYGRNNRFDHNHLAGKRNNGVTMAVRLNTEDSRENHHRIDHNYFGPRPVLGSNGGETLRIGTSHHSLTNSFTLVENNFFERCDGEVEIISNKSGGNVYRGNVFLESRGTLTLRHGNDTRVEDNVFLGNGVDHTGGIRVINKRQTVRNNYLNGLRGYRFGAALTVMNGVPESPINRYHQVEDSVIENNTIIDSSHVELAAGSDEERSAVPLTTVFRNNLIYNRDGRDIFTAHDDIAGIEFSGNVLHEVENPSIRRGFTSRSVTLEETPGGLLRPVGADLADVGAAASLRMIQRSDTGVGWYPKPQNAARFDTGSVIAVEPGRDALFGAVAAAKAGDVIELAPGRYLVNKLIEINVPLTFRASAGRPRPEIEFERTALFEIRDGGSLKLQGLGLSGASAPDNAGNSLIRTSRYSMLRGYDLLVDDCEIRRLDVNHSFNFLTVAKGTFAQNIDIRNSRFSDISGAVLELNRETDDLGLYNAEYLTIDNVVFEDVGEAVAALYRGGTDESTFGPHFYLRNSTLQNVGNNKRNKSGSSVFLHGVQVAEILDNRFTASQPIRVELTVGDPVTVIRSNVLEDTAGPEVLNGSADVAENRVLQ